MFTLKNILILFGRNAIISIIVITACFLGILFLSKEIIKLSDIAAVNNNLEREIKEDANIYEIYSYNNKIVGTNYEKIEAAYAPSDNILDFVSELDNLTNKYTTKQVYRFSTPTEPVISSPFPISTVLYSNNFATNINDFLSYLKKFEQLPYFTKIEGFKITSQDKTGWQGPSTASFDAVLYVKVIQ
jgi:hypothetical protein